MEVDLDDSEEKKFCEGDEEYKKKLQELVVKDEELVKDVIKKIKFYYF